MVFCKHCQTDLSKSEIDYGWCGSCGGILDDPYNIESINCERCGASVTFGESCCQHCNLDYPDAFWVALERKYAELMTSSASLEEPNICCGLLSEYCKCEDPIPWKVIWDIPMAIDDQVYESPDCSTCVNNFDSNCEPYRNWVKDYIRSKGMKIPHPIDGCNRYKHY